jgi:ABC-2 type transport system permease protein
MTTATLPTPAHRHTGAALTMTRLVEVELRKMVDTRAGRWLLLGVGALMIAALTIVVITTDDPTVRSFANLSKLAILPVSVILPVVGILAATSDWSQRTVLSMFSLVPSRTRIVAAKVLASIVLATIATAVAFAFAAIASLLAPLAGDVQQDWGLGLSTAGEMLMYQWLCMLLGVALGTALLNSAVAIVVYFVLPMVWSGLTTSIHSLNTLERWFDTGTTWVRLISSDPMTAEWWGQIGATSLLWIAVPIAIGTARIMRREID